MLQKGYEMKTKTKIYQKNNSFHELYVAQGCTTPLEQTQRALLVLKKNDSWQKNWTEVLKQVRTDLDDSSSSKESFRITPFVADEMFLLSDGELPRYFFHRYRYEIFPKDHRLDDYPPYLQIEPSSICNYRCVFCYQTDEDFSEKKSGYMGSMSLDLYKNIVDEAEGNIEFLSLASRGEPLVCKAFAEMMEYSVGKFLNLKVNTNASLMTEAHCHALLCGGARTIVFSADAAEEPLYSQLRVNGKLDRVLRNIERFQKIRETQYSSSSVISRVSGVLVEEDQNMESMKKLWGSLVDQISFVKYNPWENVYDSPLSHVSQPCSDLWRRIFVWYDGKVNPCDTDYKSVLKVGNVKDQPLTKVWRNDQYELLRKTHLSKKRNELSPCNRCVVV
jgi:radical SAM protein with 4Fe4S-binding SPASM domain